MSQIKIELRSDESVVDVENVPNGNLIQLIGGDSHGEIYMVPVDNVTRGGNVVILNVRTMAYRNRYGYGGEPLQKCRVLRPGETIILTIIE